MAILCIIQGLFVINIFSHIANDSWENKIIYMNLFKMLLIYKKLVYFKDKEKCQIGLQSVAIEII